jgi:hypothetical protein
LITLKKIGKKNLMNENGIWNKRGIKEMMKSAQKLMPQHYFPLSESVIEKN